MTVFDMETELSIDPAQAAEADSLALLNRRIIEAFASRLSERSVTKKQLAERMGLNKSDVSRLLRGDVNLTARKLGRVLWALEYDFDLILRDLAKDKRNHEAVVSFKVVSPATPRTDLPAKNSEAATKQVLEMTAEPRKEFTRIRLGATSSNQLQLA